MDSTTVTIISISGVALLAIILFLLIRRSRRIRARRALVPPEILADFNEAERRMHESNGEKNPHTILWEMAKERSNALKGGSEYDRTRTTERNDFRAVERVRAPEFAASQSTQADRSNVRRENIPPEPAGKIAGYNKRPKRNWQ